MHMTGVPLAALTTLPAACGRHIRSIQHVLAYALLTGK